MRFINESQFEKYAYSMSLGRAEVSIKLCSHMVFFALSECKGTREHQQHVHSILTLRRTTDGVCDEVKVKN